MSKLIKINKIEDLYSYKCCVEGNVVQASLNGKVDSYIYSNGKWKLSEPAKAMNIDDYYVDSLADLKNIKDPRIGDTRTIRSSGKVYIYNSGKWLLFASDSTKEVLINPSWDDVELERRRKVILRHLDKLKEISSFKNEGVNKVLPEFKNTKMYGRKLSFSSGNDFEAIYISLTENKGWKEIQTPLFSIKEEFTLDSYYESLVRRMF